MDHTYSPERKTDTMNRRATLLLCILACFALPLIGQAQFTIEPTWVEDFDYEGYPDPNKWGYDLGGHGWGNEEWQHYTDRLENARVENGMLVINALREDYGGNAYTSARLVTRGKGDWLYGRIVVRARWSSAPGTWPAIWMLPTDWVYGGWPDSGEIDLMEHVPSLGQTIQGSIHTRDYFFQIGTAKHGQMHNIEFWNWHDYVLEWYPDRMDILLNNTRYFSFHNEQRGYTAWPFDQRFHLLLNVAVGGWGGWPDFWNERMEVEFVRVYEYTGEPQVSVHPEAWYRIVNRQSGKVLDVSGPSTDDGANIHQWEWFDIPNQHWRFEAAGDGSLRMIARHSGKAADVTHASWADGTNVQQWPVNYSPAQEWWLQPVGGSGYVRILNRETGRVLDVAEFSNDNGANVQQWTYAGSHNQQWMIEEVEPPPAPPAPTGFQAVAGAERVTLTWNPVVGVTDYTVKRASERGGPYTVLASNITVTSFVDHDVSAEVPQYYVVVARSGSAEGEYSSEVGAIPWTLVLAINAGGEEVAPFGADAAFSGGNQSAGDEVIDLVDIVNPAPHGVYQSERYGPMTYTLSDLTPGETYRVRLHFAERFWNAAGNRRFHVLVNDQAFLANLDIFATAGRNKALVRERDATANASGQVVVQFLPAPNADQPTVSGLEVWQGPGLAPPQLSISMEDNSVLLEWPASASLFNLYATETSVPLLWEPVHDEPVVHGETNRVTLPAFGPGQFFMLSAP